MSCGLSSSLITLSFPRNHSFCKLAIITILAPPTFLQRFGGLIVVTLLFLFVFATTTTLAQRPDTTTTTTHQQNTSTSRSIKILNESGSRVEVYWIHPQTREGTLMSSPNVMHGASFPLNSFVGHEFELRELPSATSGECKSEDKVCHTASFAVSENDDQSECRI